MATHTTLRNGSKGDEVKKLQQSLIDAGYNVGSSGADGIYGNNTAAAVKAYQKANGLSVDGIAGNQTLGKLYGGSTATTTPSATESQQNTSFKYEEYTYDPYEKSDTVKQAEALLQQQVANNPTQQESAWQAQLNDTINKILNREEFSYDLNGDALYQQYKDQHTTQGQMAMMDTMGQAAAMTGGYGNSYAQGVGQQVYQGYLQQLNDKVPELYQLALSQYNQEGQDLKDQASMLDSLVQQDYQKYRDDLSDYYTELQYLTDRADTLSQQEYDAWLDKINLDYGIHSDKQTYGYQAQQDANDLAISMLSLGVMPSTAVLESSGISSADAQAIVQKVKEQADASGSGDIGDTGGNGNLPGYDNGGYESDVVKKAQEFVGASADGKWGSNSAAKAKAKGYNSLAEVVAAMGGDGDYTYEETDAVTNFVARIRTKHEFARGTNSDNTKYKSYKDYVKGMLEKYESELTDNDIATISQKFGL